MYDTLREYETDNLILNADKWALILETDDRKVYFQLDTEGRYTGVTKVEHKEIK